MPANDRIGRCHFSIVLAACSATGARLIKISTTPMPAAKSLSANCEKLRSNVFSPSIVFSAYAAACSTVIANKISDAPDTKAMGAVFRSTRDSRARNASASLTHF